MHFPLRVNIGFEVCRVEYKIKAECGILEILSPVYQMKISWQDRDAVISIGGMQDSSEIVGGMRDLNSKQPFVNLTRWIEIKLLEVAGWQDESKTSGGYPRGGGTPWKFGWGLGCVA